MKAPQVNRLLTQHQAPVWQRIQAEMTSQLVKGFLQWQPAQDKQHWVLADSEVAALLSQYLQSLIQQQLDKVDALHLAHKTFEYHMAHSESPAERSIHIRAFADKLKQTPYQRRTDARAVKQQFDHKAVNDRYRRQRQNRLRLSVYALEQMAALMALAFTEHNDDKSSLWHRFQLMAFYPRILSITFDERLPVAALKGLTQVAAVLPERFVSERLDDHLLHFINRAALETSRDTELQREAISLVAQLAPELLESVLHRRLKKPAKVASDLFVRCHAVDWLCTRITTLERPLDLVNRVLSDPSDHVRQRLAENLYKLPLALFFHALSALLQDDKAIAVRCSTLVHLPQVEDDTQRIAVLAQLTTDLVRETNNDVFYCLTTLLPCLHQGALDSAMQHPDTDITTCYQHCSALLSWLDEKTDCKRVSQAIAQAREHLWRQTDQQRLRTFKALKERISVQPAGKVITIKRQGLFAIDDASLTRLLSQVVQNDHGLDVDIHPNKLRIRKGHRFGFRLWRCLYEWRNPATDKREAFKHWTGRRFYGRHHFPSGILAERSPTTVPGEPRIFSDEGSWRPWLPLVDELISCLDTGWPTRPVNIYTPEGITEILPPKSVWRRLHARTLLTLRFAYYADLRNWTDQNGKAPADYVKAIQKLGFRIHHKAYTDQPSAEKVKSRHLLPFFPVLALPALNTELWLQMENYFFSVYQNSLLHLAAFLGVIGCVFIARHISLSLYMKHLRKKIPLVIGGWGSRGKSGTERLKSALFNAKGLSVLSKTTGCEAMMLHCDRHGPLRELGLFRPYEKATIWEQMDVVKMAAKLKCDVYLWECMGLTPAFIRILQQHWMRDDIATITNCYPDHEDLQGPAGINIPTVMCDFIPTKSLLITSEIEMLPILQEAARTRKTRILSVPWLAQRLLCDDILDYFPYQEHPSNIALVMTIAEELGIERDFALQSMAENVVADIGVLNCFPYAEVNGRQLQFINGMSANERFATMENWRRMQFDRLAEQDSAGIWLSTIINNRADRISRSKVFAQLLVEELSADRHYLVGSNLDGMQNYIEEAWQQQMANFSLWQAHDGTVHDGTVHNREHERTAALQRYDRACQKIRLAKSAEKIQQQLQHILHATLPDLTDNEINKISACWQTVDLLQSALNAQQYPNLSAIQKEQFIAETLAFIEQQCHELHAYKILYQQIASAETDTVTRMSIDKNCKTQLWSWFQTRIIIVEDTAPNALLGAICQQSPRGIKTRIMGLQNIKGPGLGFVYLWRGWESFLKHTQTVLTGSHRERQKALEHLVATCDFNPLCNDYGKNWLKQAHQLQSSQNSETQDQLAAIEAALTRTGQLTVNTTTQSHRFGYSLIKYLEAFLDAGQAVRRRKKADRTYRQWVAEQISFEKAVEIIADINLQQANGWLYQRIKKGN